MGWPVRFAARLHALPGNRLKLALSRVGCGLHIRAGRCQMTPRFVQPGWLIVLVGITCAWPVGVAAAQVTDQPSEPTSSLSAVTARVPIGDVVYVTETTGATLKGKLAGATEDAVEVNVQGVMRSVSAGHILQIQRRQSDSVLGGVLIGAAIGAVPGVYWLITDPNECSGMCPEEYALIGIGAAVGGLIDWLIKGRVTVYSAGAASGRSKDVIIGPLVKGDRTGVCFAVRF